MEGNLAGNWKKWLTAYKIYAGATGVTAKPEKPQCFVFLHVAGEEAPKLFPTLDIEPSDREKIGPLTDAFRQYCESNANVTLVRYHLNMFYQRDESMDTYIREVHHKIAFCEYGALEKSIFRDRLLCGLN